MTDLLLAYFADDLTGSTDALEVLSKAGARTLLFTRPPTSEILDRYPNLDAIGIAGNTRAFSPDAMEAELPAALEALRRLSPRHIHYKVCSTFDSSPTRGSIGRAIDIGRRVVGSSYVPLLAAAPSLGRYCAFGHLFAAAGIGFDGEVFRLDRHPSASTHPTTPMRESDLRIHLREQTNAAISTFDVTNFELPAAEQRRRLKDRIEQGADVILFDSLNQQHLLQTGALIDHGDLASRPQFSVGSSGVESALTLYWMESGQLSPRAEWVAPDHVDRALVVAGSCSRVTAAQIEWAKKTGFVEVALDAGRLAAADYSPEEMHKPTAQIVQGLDSGSSVVVHTSAADVEGRSPRPVNAERDRAAPQEAAASRGSDRLGMALGQMISRVLEQTTVPRLCVAGGDTASCVSREIAIESIEMKCPLTAGAPLCEIHAPGSCTDGLEVVFKGGQVGSRSFFGSILTGTVD